MAFVDFDPPAKPEGGGFIDFSKPQEPRSLLKEVPVQAYAGATIDLPKQVGQAMQWMSEPGQPTYEKGKEIADWAERRESENPDLAPQTEGRGLIGRALSTGARALAPSAAVMVPAAAAAPLGLPAAAVAAGVGAFGIFGAAQAQETYDKLLKSGVPEGEARKAGWINLMIEGGGETIGDVAGLKLFGMLGKAVGGSSVASAIKGATDSSIAAPYLKQLGKTGATEIATEFGQNFGEAWVENKFGAQNPEDPLHAGVQGAEAALGMTLLLAPFGLAGFARRAKENQKVADALTDADAPEALRIAAGRIVFDEINAVNPDAAKAWSQNVTIAIAGKAPVILDEVTATPNVSQTDEKIARIDSAHDVDEAIALASEAVDSVPVTDQVRKEIEFAQNGRMVLEAMERRIQEEQAYAAREQRMVDLDAERAAVMQEDRSRVHRDLLAGMVAKGQGNGPIAQKLREALGMPDAAPSTAAPKGELVPETRIPETAEQAQEFSDHALDLARNLTRSDATRALIDEEILRRKSAALTEVPTEAQSTSTESAPATEVAPVTAQAAPAQEAAPQAAAAEVAPVLPQGPAELASAPPEQGVEQNWVDMSTKPTVVPDAKLFGKPIAEATDKQLTIALKHRLERVRTAAKAEMDRREGLVFKVPEAHHEMLRLMAKHSGWIERGGLAAGSSAQVPIKGAKSQRQMNEEGIGRTVWVGQPDWARGSTPTQIAAAVEKAIAGKTLGKTQRSLVEAMLADIEETKAALAEVQALPADRQDAILTAVENEPVPDGWSTMTEDEKNAELDAIFGAEKSPAQGEGPRAQAAEEEVRPAEQAGEREPGSDDEVRSVAPARKLFAEWAGQRHEVASLEDAQRKWERFRTSSGAGASELGSARVVDSSGTQVARIAYNGRLFTTDGREMVKMPGGDDFAEIPHRDAEEGPAITVDTSPRKATEAHGVALLRSHGVVGKIKPNTLYILSGHWEGYKRTSGVAEQPYRGDPAKALQEFRENNPNATPQAIIATDEGGNPSKVLSPNGNSVADFNSAEGQYILGDVDAYRKDAQRQIEQGRSESDPDKVNAAVDERVRAVRKTIADIERGIAAHEKEHSADLAKRKAGVPIAERDNRFSTWKEYLDNSKRIGEALADNLATAKAELARWEAQRVREVRPTLELAAPTEAALKAKDRQAAEGNVEERTAALRDRDEAILTPPAGTAPARAAADQKVPTQQSGLFGAAAALRQAADAIEKSVQPAKPEPKLTDVGENLWANRRNFTRGATTWEDVKGLNDALKVKEVVKGKVWPKPNYEQLVADGMQPFFARMLKQVYDGISVAPAGKSDQDLERYIEVVGRIRDAVFAWAKDNNANRAFLEEAAASMAPGTRTSLMEMSRQRDYTTVLLAKVWPDGFGEGGRYRINDAARTDLRAIGGNRAYRALQFTTEDFRDAVTDLNKGWPKSQEQWQRQGYKVAPSSQAVVNEGARYGKGDERTVVWTVATATGWSGSTIGNSYTTKAEAEAARADLKPFMLLDKRGRLVSEHDTEAQAKEAARELTKREAKGGEVRGMNIAQAERKGPERRQEGDNITPERLMAEFGFRGVNFGRESYINQAERQAYLNHAYDGLMDLAEILEVPPKALSLNGMLGLAFGAQGRGGHAAAHFVAGHNEINLTKTMGAGTLAHEWGHAVDHYFATQAGYAKASDPFLSQYAASDVLKAGPGDLRPEILAAFREVVETMTKRPMTETEFKAREAMGTKAAIERLERWIQHFRKDIERVDASKLPEFDKLAERMRKGDLGDGYVKVGGQSLTEVVGALKTLVKGIKNISVNTADNYKGLESNASSVEYRLSEKHATNTHIPQTTNTAYAAESSAKDQGKGGKPYWRTPWEMFARAFETYVASRLEDEGRANTFLSDASLRAESRDRNGGYAMPYPREEDRTRINAAIDKLVQAIETKESDKGVAMFSRQADNIERYAFQRGNDKNGQPAFANDEVILANAEPDRLTRGEGVRSYKWKIYDRTKPGENGARYLKVGELYADLTPEGQFEALRGITIYNRYRQQGNGYGESVVASMLATNGPGVRMGVVDIVHSTPDPRDNALPFWKKLGVRQHNLSNDPNVEINGDVSLGDYLRARGEKGKFSRDEQADTAEAQPTGRQASPEGNARAREAGSAAGAGREGVPGRSSRQAQALGIASSAVRQAVTPILEKWGNAPEVVIIDSMDDAPEPVRLQDEGARSQGATGAPEAFIYRDRVYLVAEGIDSPAAATRALFHEALGHFGLRGTLGERINPVLEEVAKSAPDRVRAKARSYGLDFNDIDQRRQAAEEVLAEIAQSRPNSGIVRRAIAAIREFLREMGVQLELTDNDIINNFILPAREFVERGEGSYGMQAAPAFGRETAWYFSPLERKLQDLKQASAPAAQWKATIKSMKGVSKDELEWSGVNEWLDMQQGKVTKEAILDYLAQNGVKVTETMLRDDGNDPATREVDRLKVELDALGYTVEQDYDGMGAVRRRSDGAEFLYNGDGFYDEDEVKLEGEAAELALRLGPLMDADSVSTVEGRQGAFGTKYGSYALPGGEKYRELLLTLQTKRSDEDRVQLENRLASEIAKERFGKASDDLSMSQYNAVYSEVNERIKHADGELFRSGHFDQPNILAHVRFDERTDVEGKRVLFLEEIQSDWAQQGKRDGFTKSTEGWTATQLRSNEDGGFNHWQINDASGNPVTKIVGGDREGAIRKAAKGVPSAPFVGKTEAWVGLALKRMIRYAADNGFDRVAWTTGKQQADRYSLRKSVESIEWKEVRAASWAPGANTPPEDGKKVNISMRGTGGYFSLFVGHSGVVHGGSSEFEGKRLEDVIGKAAAAKIAESPTGELKERGLEIGGEGMLAFYDDVLPKIANRLLEKLGGGRVAPIRMQKTDKNLDLDRKELEEAAIAYMKGQTNDEEFMEAAGGIQLTAAELEDVSFAGGRDEGDRGAQREAARTFATTMLERHAGQKQTRQPGFDITPAMREAAGQGLALFSRSAHMGTLTSAQEAALRNVHGDPETWRTKLDDFKANWKKNLVQGIFDQFAPIAQYSPKAYRLARQAKGADSTLEALLLYGKVYVDKDGAYKVDYTKQGGMQGFAKVIAELHGEQDRFLEWVAAHRAERLKSVGLENLYSDTDIAALKTLSQGSMKDGKPRAAAYAKALKDLNEFNDSVLKIAVYSGLVDEETRLMYKDMPYVPFYRLQEEGVAGFGMKAGLVNQSAWKKLKGGTAHLNEDLLANLLQNWSHMITAAAKNRAAKATLEAAVSAKVAEEVPSGTPGKGLVHFMDAGKERIFRVSDSHLMDAIAAMHYAGLGPVAKPFIAMKRYLTIGVTVNPAFKIRNLIRDSIQAIGTAELSYNPAKNIAQGFKATEKTSETRAQLLAGGGMIRFGSMLDGNNADRTRRLIEQNVDPEMILDNASKIERFWKSRVLPAFDAYQELGDRGEQISRAALYEQLLAKGMSHEEAAFWARDLLDFSLSGKWGAVRILTQVVPFANARLQGMYKLGRATKTDYKRMGTTLGAVGLASIALLLAYGDDDDWKKREDWDRDNYWWFKIAGFAFRIPKPFEIGAVGTLAERSLEYMIDKEMTGKRFRERIAATVFSQLSMNPTPQLVKPLMDLYANKDSFSGRPIETMGMEKLRKQDRFNEHTSEVAKFLGSLGLPDPTQLAMGQWNTLSPVQIDSLVRGYFGWLGTSTTTALDWGIRPMLERGQRPDMKLRDVFLAGNFVETLPANSSRYVTRLYEQAKEIEQAYGSYHDALKRGDREKAAQVMAEEGDKLRKYKMVETIKRRESLLTAQARRIEASKDMAGDEKRRRLDQIEQRKSDLARMLR